MPSFTQNFIGGRRVDPLGEDVINVYSHYDGSLTGSAPAASTADIDLAVSIARDAFDNGPWVRMEPADRLAVMARFAKCHAARAEEFAQLITREREAQLLAEAGFSGIEIFYAGFLWTDWSAQA